MKKLRMTSQLLKSPTKYLWQNTLKLWSQTVTIWNQLPVSKWTEQTELWKELPIRKCLKARNSVRTSVYWTKDLVTVQVSTDLTPWSTPRDSRMDSTRKSARPFQITPNSTTVDAQKTQSTLKITSRLGTKSRTSNQSSTGQRKTQFITLVEFHPATKSRKLSEPSLKVSKLAALLTSALWTPLLSLQLAPVRTWPILSTPLPDVIWMCLTPLSSQSVEMTLSDPTLPRPWPLLKLLDPPQEPITEEKAAICKPLRQANKSRQSGE